MPMVSGARLSHPGPGQVRGGNLAKAAAGKPAGEGAGGDESVSSRAGAPQVPFIVISRRLRQEDHVFKPRLDKLGTE